MSYRFFSNLVTTVRQRMLQARDEKAVRQLCKSYRIAGTCKRIYHYHIRKTGGTSLNQSMLSLADDPADVIYQRLGNTAPGNRLINGDKVFVGWNQRLIEEGNYFYAFSHIPKHRLSLPDDTFTFTCLRDPMKRVLSHYWMLKEMVEQNSAHSVLAVEGSWVSGTFDDFIKCIPKDHLLRQIYMFSPTFDLNEAIGSISSCDAILETEQLGDGILGLGEKLDLTLPPLHSRKGRGEQEEIPQESRDHLREVLDVEYRFIERIRDQILPKKLAPTE